MVESALILILYFTILLGVIEFGRCVWIYNTLAFACREGARYAISRGADAKPPATSTDIANVVKSKVIGLDTSLIGVTVSWVPDNKAGSSVKVQTTYSFSPITTFVNLSSMTLRSTSEMPISF